MVKPVYESTNESLLSITKGLDIQPDDTILAVLGSGDQAFAMLEFGATIFATDINHVQCIFAQERRNALYQKDLKSFLPNLPLDARYFPEVKSHFLNYDRLERIRSNLDNLQIIKGDILDEINPRFSKIYFSNVFDYNNGGLKTLPAINPGTLIYAAFYREDQPSNILLDNHCLLVQDETLTSLAVEHEGTWDPFVFRATDSRKVNFNPSL